MDFALRVCFPRRRSPYLDYTSIGTGQPTMTIAGITVSDAQFAGAALYVGASWAWGAILGLCDRFGLTTPPSEPLAPLRDDSRLEGTGEQPVLDLPRRFWRVT